MITPDCIQDVLTAIRDIEPLPRNHPIFEAEFVMRELQKLPRDGGDYDRLYALKQLFCRIVQGKLGNYGNSLANGRFEAIQTVFAAFNNQRQAYIAIFHCYLDPNGVLTTSQFAKVSHFSTRTIRRRLEYGVKLITIDSIAAELDFQNVRNSLEIVPFEKRSQDVEGAS